MVKEINLTQGKVALVDDEDYDDFNLEHLDVSMNHLYTEKILFIGK